jgi:hypothetical protein
MLRQPTNPPSPQRMRRYQLNFLAAILFVSPRIRVRVSRCAIYSRTRASNFFEHACVLLKSKNIANRDRQSAGVSRHFVSARRTEPLRELLRPTGRGRDAGLQTNRYRPRAHSPSHAHLDSVPRCRPGSSSEVTSRSVLMWERTRRLQRAPRTSICPTYLPSEICHCNGRDGCQLLDTSLPSLATFLQKGSTGPISNPHIGSSTYKTSAF